MASTRKYFEDKDAVFWKLMTKPENRVCFDCNAKNPTFGSVWYGVFVCLECSNSKFQQSLGFSNCHARHLYSAPWSSGELRMMILGGNYRAKVFFNEHGWTDDGSRNMKAKYLSNAAQLYKELLFDELLESSEEERNEALKQCSLHLSEHIEETDLARRKFPNAKSISSAQFFEYQENMNDSEAKFYLKNFLNSTAISSDEFNKCKGKYPLQYTMDQAAIQEAEDCTQVEEAGAENQNGFNSFFSSFLRSLYATN